MPGQFRHIFTLGFLCIFALATAGAAEAQLVTWDLNGTLDSDMPVSPEPTPANVSAGRLTKAPALTPETFVNAFVASDWPTTSSLDPDKYFEFQVSAGPGYVIEYGRVEFSLYNNFNGSSQWAIRSDVDDFTTNLDFGAVADVVQPGAPVQADVSALGSRKGNVTFRVYTFDNTGSTDPNRRGFRGSDFGGLDLNLYGTVRPARPTAPIAIWTLVGNTVDSGNPLPPSFTASDATAGNLLKSSALAAESFVNAFMARGWPVGPTVDLDKYFEFTVSADPGFEILYDCVEFSLYNNFDGETQWQVRSSEDGYSTILDSGYQSGIFHPGAPVRADVSDLGFRKGSVTFRFYCFENTGDPPVDRRGFRGSGGGGGLDLKIYGTVFQSVSSLAIATWRPNGLLDSANPLAASAAAADVTAGSLEKSAALGAETAIDAFVASGWPLTAAIDPDRYLSFTVAADPGFEIQYECVIFSLYNDDAGTVRWEIRSSEDAFTTPLDTGVETSITAGGAPVIADLSRLGTRKSSVTFRLYTSANTGTTDPDHRGLRGSSSDGLDLVILGTVESLTASTAVALWAPNGTIDSADPLPPSATAANVSASALVKSGTLTAEVFANAFVASGWPLTPAIDPSKYFAFEITPDLGFEVLYECLEFSLYNNFDGGSAWQIRGSHDGYASVLDAGFETGIFGSGTPVLADLSALGAREEPLTIRFYTSDNSGSTGPDRRGFRGSDAGGRDLRLLGRVLPGGTTDTPPGLPPGYSLSQNVPNPFRQVTHIAFRVPVSQKVDLRIYDVRGRHVRTLLSGEETAAGLHDVPWDARDETGSPVPTGIYLYRLRSSGFEAWKRMLVIGS